MCACENSIVKYVVSFPYFINCIIKNKKHYNTRTDKVMHSNNHWSPTEKARLSSAIANQPSRCAERQPATRRRVCARSSTHDRAKARTLSVFRCFGVHGWSSDQSDASLTVTVANVAGLFRVVRRCVHVFALCLLQFRTPRSVKKSVVFLLRHTTTSHVLTLYLCTIYAKK